MRRAARGDVNATAAYRRNSRMARSTSAQSAGAAKVSRGISITSAESDRSASARPGNDPAAAVTTTAPALTAR